MDNRDTGLLLNDQDIKIHRDYFVEMCSLLGRQVIYRSPRPDKKWDGFGELDSSFNPPLIVGCILQENPNQWTLKKLGWAAELQEEVSIIDVAYDLPGLQIGALFILPSNIDNSKGRVFKVIRMRTGVEYPASITCELAPVYEDHFDKGQDDHSDNTGNLLYDTDQDNGGDGFIYLKEKEEILK